MHFSSDLFIEISSKIVGTGISKILKFAGGKGRGYVPRPTGLENRFSTLSSCAYTFIISRYAPDHT